MPLDFKVEMIVHDEFITEFLELIEEDKLIALSLSGNIIKSFTIIRDNKNKNHFLLLQTIKSKKEFLEHLSQEKYKWKEFINTNGVISYDTSLLYYID
jgi:hypothetical protein